MMEAVTYGVILNAKIVKLLKDPPENKSNRSNNPPWFLNMLAS